MSWSFQASRMSGHRNTIFPDKIEIDENKVTYYKGAIIGYDSTVISRDSVASVSIGSGVIFADVVIETKGGKRVELHGFLKSEAKQIVKLLSQD
jgi:hypothetical protein